MATTVAIGAAFVLLARGAYWPAFGVLTGAVVGTCLLARTGTHDVGKVWPWVPPSRAALTVAVLVQLALLATGGFAVQFEPGAAGLLPGWALCVCAAGATLIVAYAPPRWTGPAFAGLLLAHLVLGVWVIRHAGSPGTDVNVFQQGAVGALRGGLDPYAVRFRNIYHPYEGFYGPGLVKNGVLQFGFPYPPLALLLLMPFQLVAADVRYAHVFFATLGGALLGWARPGRLAFLAAALLLFSPRFTFVLQMAWNEPIALALLALVLFLVARRPRAAPYAFGAFIAFKQYLVFAVPLAWLLLPAGERTARGFGRWALRAAVVAAAVTLPLALRHPAKFLHSVVWLQFLQPLRIDALCLPAVVARLDGPRLTLLAFPVALVALVLLLRRSEASPRAFCYAMAATYALFLYFNKQASENYYAFVMGLLAAAVASPPAEPAAAPVRE